MSAEVFFTFSQYCAYTGQDRGWVLYEIRAYRGSQHIGSLRLDYIPRQEFDRRFQSEEDLIKEGIGGSLRRTLIDKPQVAYIWVDPQERRKGLGTQLYQEGVARLGRVYASGIQSFEAKKVWASMRYQHKSGRRFLGQRFQDPGSEMLPEKYKDILSLPRIASDYGPW